MADHQISGRGQPYQERAETAEYRIIYSPQVAVRDKPWGKVIAARRTGDSIKTTHKTVGLTDGTWVKTATNIDAHGAPGWLLVDGKAINLPMLLEKVERGRKGMVTRWRVAVDSLDIRERPSLAGTPVVGTRKKGALVRSDQELNGFVRIQHDFYVAGKAEPVEGWAVVHGKMMGLGYPMLERWEPTNSLPAISIGTIGAQAGQTSRWWVMPAEGVPVRERPWGRVLCSMKRGKLLRCDTEKDGWVRIEADFTEEGPLDAYDENTEARATLCRARDVCARVDVGACGCEWVCARVMRVGVVCARGCACMWCVRMRVQIYRTGRARTRALGYLAEHPRLSVARVRVYAGSDAPRRLDTRRRARPRAAASASAMEGGEAAAAGGGAQERG